MKKRPNDRQEIDQRRAGSAVPSMRLPHERDTSNDRRESSPPRVMKRAHDDLAYGLVDPDERGVEAGRAFARNLEGSAGKRSPSAPRAAKRRRTGP